MPTWPPGPTFSTLPPHRPTTTCLGGGLCAAPSIFPRLKEKNRWFWSAPARPLGHLATWLPGYLASWPPTWPPGHLNTWPPGHLATCPPGHRGPPSPRCPPPPPHHYMFGRGALRGTVYFPTPQRQIIFFELYPHPDLFKRCHILKCLDIS